jgi:hypothetical protein
MSSATVNTNIYEYIDTIFQQKYIYSIVLVIISISIFLTYFPKKKSYSDDYLENKTNVVGWFVSTIIFLIIFVFIIFGILKFFFGINVFVSFKNFFKKEIDLIAVEPKREYKPKPPRTSQVFNIPGNNYTYNEAIDLCKAYGAEIADYSQLENAYKEGANWCNYGWSKDQLALFPIQKSTYDNLQKIEGHENDCGRPGINGGFMSNPFNRYGVNCYGKKPPINSEEATLMKIDPTEDNELNKKVEYWKGQIPNILISPFNSNTWSKL